jgi:hypothetical protein
VDPIRRSAARGVQLVEHLAYAADHDVDRGRRPMARRGDGKSMLST